jgi:hypothetical protein
MNAQIELTQYQEALRENVCRRCIERRPGAPPCGPLGKPCGIEQHVRELADICRQTDSNRIDPYVEMLHNVVCENCEAKGSPTCPCPLDYLMLLAVEAVEDVQSRHVVC